MSRQIRLIILLSRPVFLLGGALVYALGAGIARYLGAPIDWGLYILGQAYVTTMQLSAQYLNEYFDSPADQDNPNRTPFSGGSGAVGDGKLSQETVMWAALTVLTILASLTVVMLNVTSLSPLLVTIVGLAFLGSFFYSAPPVKLANSGYGELTTSVLVANLVPVFAFVLQYGELHRLLVMSTFPLTALHLAMMIVFEFPDYLNDIKYEKYTLLVRVGWERGMVLHNMASFSDCTSSPHSTSAGLAANLADEADCQRREAQLDDDGIYCCCPARQRCLSVGIRFLDAVMWKRSSLEVYKCLNF
jgi:1,4-dihydroxy-2-naphthoate octaprenyltransferase